MKEMTRTLILAMPAGPEMDALVASLVMGETLDWEHTWAHRVKGERPIIEWLCTLCNQRWGWRAQTPRCTAPARKRSDDIGRAWEVVEKRRDDGVCFSMEVECAKGDAIEPLARFFTGGHGQHAGGDREHAAFGPAPLAICRAALLSTLARP